ncbi:MAG: hypothetical protein KKB02_20085 [Alphaproteobacteria bacterium]|nr:hypothetical protein [Alphaproteobacteria bacterium]
MLLATKFDVSRVQSKGGLIAVGSFRYNCYLADGLIGNRADGSFLDEYDYVDNAQVYVLKSGDRIGGTIRLHILDRASARSATMSAFYDILQPKILAGLTLIDGARFAVAPDLGARRLSVARQTLRIYANFAKLHDVDYGIAAVSQDRVAFYSQLYGFDQLSEPRSYGGLSKKLVLMGVDLRTSGFADRHARIS